MLPQIVIEIFMTFYCVLSHIHHGLKAQKVKSDMSHKVLERGKK